MKAAQVVITPKPMPKAKAPRMSPKPSRTRVSRIERASGQRTMALGSPSGPSCMI